LNSFPIENGLKISPPGITKLVVAGFKSLSVEQSVEIRPLTILAGANSSGKSSLMQAVLLLKQTLDAPFDPGTLLISGPNVRFTSSRQLLSAVAAGKMLDRLVVGIEVASGDFVKCTYRRVRNGFDIDEMEVREHSDNAAEDVSGKLRPGMSAEEIAREFPDFADVISPEGRKPRRFVSVAQQRCFLGLRFSRSANTVRNPEPYFGPSVEMAPQVTSSIQDIIHVPGLRGNPERTYPLAGATQRFSGTFEKYTASIVGQWQRRTDKRLAALGRDLELLGLTWRLEAKRLSETEVDLRVARLPARGRGRVAYDSVSVADVGLGLSQALPVLVALRSAQPGQLVYIEQPEIHLHPKAQVKLAEILADAVGRDVRVVVETHSSLLLLAIQSLVADRRVASSALKLHWFSRSTDGVTTIASADLDEAGSFGNWPEDFADVGLRLEEQYLDAVEARRRAK
jgi:ABC-type cobalamin/Fe3+-siderophores transport system ATPase subunit